MITVDDDSEFNEMIATLSEVEAAIRRLQNGKAPGIDSLTAELLKADMVFSTNRIHQLLNKIWDHEKILINWKSGLIIRLAKKGNLKECKNWEGYNPTIHRGQSIGEDPYG